MNASVTTLLQRKGHEVVTIEQDALVFDAIQKMVTHKVGSVVITDGPRVCGILTERDYMKRIVLCGRRSQTTKVSEVMTTRVHFASPSDTLETCMRTMTEERCRHLPVVHRQRLIGLVSIGDCVAQLLDELRAENGALYQYIGGLWPL